VQTPEQKVNRKPGGLTLSKLDLADFEVVVTGSVHMAKPKSGQQGPACSTETQRCTMVRTPCTCK